MAEMLSNRWVLRVPPAFAVVQRGLLLGRSPRVGRPGGATAERVPIGTLWGKVPRPAVVVASQTQAVKHQPLIQRWLETSFLCHQARDCYNNDGPSLPYLVGPFS